MVRPFSEWIKDVVVRRTSLAADDLVALVTDDPNGAAIGRDDLVAQVGAQLSLSVSTTEPDPPTLLWIDETDFSLHVYHGGVYVAVT